jgi:ferrous-iron efflux pump FieF
MHTDQDKSLLKKSQSFSVITACIICLVKMYSWVYTDSMAIFASLIDSLVDVSASLITFIALRIALLPPDHNHRFGHNKVEDLAVFGQAILITASAGYALFISVKHILYGSNDVVNNDLGIASMVISTILTVILLAYQTYVIKKTQSTIIISDRLHYITDLSTNLLVIISLYIGDSYVVLDSAIGVVISISIIYTAYGLFINALQNLIDQELSDDDRKDIITIISSIESVKGLHELRTRHAGNKSFIQFHIELDGNISLYQSHEIADIIMNKIIQKFPGADVFVHQDPYGIERNEPYHEVLIRGKRVTF